MKLKRTVGRKDSREMELGRIQEAGFEESKAGDNRSESNNVLNYIITIQTN